MNAWEIEKTLKHGKQWGQELVMLASGVTDVPPETM